VSVVISLRCSKICRRASRWLVRNILEENADFNFFRFSFRNTLITFPENKEAISYYSLSALRMITVSLC
jgi:hypothetical protein